MRILATAHSAWRIPALIFLLVSWLLAGSLESAPLPPIFMYAMMPSGQDTTPPVVTCPPNAVLAADSNCLAIHTWMATAIDNCDSVVTIVSTPASGTAFALGMTTVTVEATDDSSNTASCTFTVQVNDNIAPTAVCRANNPMVFLDGTGNGVLPANQGDGNSTDLCGPVVESSAPVAVTCSDVGLNNYLLVASDTTGNSNSVNCLFQVLDTLAPNALCRDDSIYIQANGSASTTASAIDNGSSDNCGIASLSLSNSTFGCADLGLAHTVVLTVNDVNGNTDTCHALVTVLDTGAHCCQPPNIFNIGSVDTVCNLGATSFMVDSVTGDVDSLRWQVSTDNGATWTDLGDGLVNYDSTTTDTLVIVDVPVGFSGNLYRLFSYGCSILVDSSAAYTLIMDMGGPAISNCPSTLVSFNATGFCSATVNYPTILTNDICAPDSMVQIQGLGSGANYQVGNTVNVWVAYYLGASDTCSFQVMVQDTLVPALTGCLNDSTVYTGALCQHIYNWPLPMAADNCPGVVVTEVSGFSPPVVFSAGIHELNYIATDAGGNQDSCSWTVTVVDTLGPTFSSCPASDTVFAADTVCGATPNWAAPVIDDNCILDSFSLDSSHQSGDFFALGTTSVYYAATDTAGNVDTCWFQITVLDTLPPMAMCRNDTIWLNASGVASLSAGQVDNGSSDACGIDSMYVGPDVFDSTDVGINQVLLTVLDNEGNWDTCTAIITVLDTNIGPLVVLASSDTTICLGDSVVLGGNPAVMGGIPQYTYQWSPATGLDDPSLANPTASPVSSTQYFLVVNDGANQSDSDWVNITVMPPPAVDLGNDTTLCLGDSLVLDAVVPNGNYLWSDQSTQSTLTVQEAGAYFVNVSDSFCITTDSIQVGISIDLDSVKFLVNGTGCVGDSMHFVCISDIDENLVSALYEFGNGSTSTSLNPIYVYSAAGTYTVRLTAGQGTCTSQAVEKPVEIIDCRDGGVGDDWISISVFPNPAPGAFQVKVDLLDDGPSSLQLVDVHGRITETRNHWQKSYSEHFSGFATGFYLLRVISRNRVYPFKVVGKIP